MRRIIKRFLKKYDYPPKQAKKALGIVMKQAETMMGNIDPRDLHTRHQIAAEEKEKYGDE